MVGVTADWGAPDAVAMLGVAMPIAIPGVMGHRFNSFAFGVVTAPGDTNDPDCKSSVGKLIWPGALLLCKLPVPSGLKLLRYTSSRLISSSTNGEKRLRKTHLPKLTAEKY